MRAITRSIMFASLVPVSVCALVLSGCDTWHGLGKDIGKTGDAMAGSGKYAMTVRATPDVVTPAARRAVEQLRMTDVDSSGDRSEGKVTAKTAKLDSVKIVIEQLGATDSTVTIYTHGTDADDVSKKIQDQIKSNLR